MWTKWEKKLQEDPLYPRPLIESIVIHTVKGLRAYPRKFIASDGLPDLKKKENSLYLKSLDVDEDSLLSRYYDPIVSKLDIYLYDGNERMLKFIHNKLMDPSFNPAKHARIQNDYARIQNDYARIRNDCARIQTKLEEQVEQGNNQEEEIKRLQKELEKQRELKTKYEQTHKELGHWKDIARTVLMNPNCEGGKKCNQEQFHTHF